MWSRIPLNVLPKINRNFVRTFLSESYKCTESWNQRLTSPVLKNISPVNFYYDLEQKFQNYGKLSAIDIDILASKISEGGDIDSLADLLHKHRLTEETSNTLDSTGHSLIRACLDKFQIQELLHILDDRLNYGIFLDSFAANLCLDGLIKNKDFKSAAKVATLIMLQEDFSNKITLALSLYACVKHLQTPDLFKVVEPEAPAETVPKTKKKVEEIKVRVKYIRNPYFDDHFDLKDENALVGKTLVMVGEQIPGTVGNTAQLLGYGLYGKYEKGCEFLTKIGSDVHTEAVGILKAFLGTVKVENNEHFAYFYQKVNELAGSSNSFENDVVNFVNAMVSENEAADVEAQKKIYSEWCELRQQKLREELERLQRKKRLDEIEQMTKSMADEEQKLWFFENEEKIDLQIDSKKIFYHKRWFGKKKKPRTVDEGYVPPEVQKKRV